MDRDDTNQITQQIIGAAFTVSNQLGCGFLEKVYKNSLVVELRKQGYMLSNKKG